MHVHMVRDKCRKKGNDRRKAGKLHKRLKQYWYKPFKLSTSCKNSDKLTIPLQRQFIDKKCVPLKDCDRTVHGQLRSTYHIELIVFFFSPEKRQSLKTCS